MPGSDLNPKRLVYIFSHNDRSGYLPSAPEMLKADKAQTGAVLVPKKVLAEGDGNPTNPNATLRIRGLVRETWQRSRRPHCHRRLV